MINLISYSNFSSRVSTLYLIEQLVKSREKLEGKAIPFKRNEELFTNRCQVLRQCCRCLQVPFQPRQTIEGISYIFYVQSYNNISICHTPPYTSFIMR